MIYDSYTTDGKCFDFVKGSEHLVIPSQAVILVDDESGMLAVKNPASRATVALVRK